MASGEVSGAIEAHLIANWAATPLLFENKTTFENGKPAPPSEPELFVEVSFTGRAYGQESIGVSPVQANRWDEDGLVFFDVLAPVGSGALSARERAKELVDLFRGITLLNGDLYFRDASIGQGDKSAKYDGNYFVIPVDLEWLRVESPQET